MAAFSCGVILLYRVGVIPPLYGLIAAILLLIPVSWVTPRRISRETLSILLFGIVGLGWATGFASDRLTQQLPQQWEGQTLMVSGYLCDIPSPGNYQSIRFSLCVTAWPEVPEHEVQAGPLPDKLRLAWYGEQATLGLPHRVRATVVLKRPHGSLNPQGFRYESWLFRAGYRATGTVRGIEPETRVPCGLRCRYHRWRNLWASALHQQLSSTRHYGLAEALLMGHRGWIEPSQWAVFKDTGTIHLVAISGLHLGLIAFGVGAVVRRFLLILPPSLATPGRLGLVTACLVLTVCLGYALLAGFTVPTRRALLMVAVACWVMVRARQSSPWDGWLLALCLVLLLDPFAPLDQGFWLSFGAVAVLILVFSRWLGRCHWGVALLLAQAAVFVGLWPILAGLGQPQVTMGALANLIAIPWVSLVVMPVLLLGGILLVVIPGSEGVVGWAYDLVLEALWQVLSWLAAWSVPLPAGNLVVPLTLAAVVLTAILIPVRHARLLAAVVCGVWLVRSLAEPGATASGNDVVARPEVWIWDVGQGLSVLVRHQDQVLVYDTGPSSPGGYSAVESVLLPNYAALGVRYLDALVLSHGDSDHSGGLGTLLAAVPVGLMVSGEPERIRQQLVVDNVPPVLDCGAVDGRRVGEVLVAAWQYSEDARADGNERSCVVSLRFGGIELILPGDIPASVERAYLADHGPLTSTYRVVVVPHHGSRTSSGEDWVAALVPDVAIVSAGYRHRFGHPHPDVSERYQRAGGWLVNTAESGAIHLRFFSDGVAISRARENPPFWIEAAPQRFAIH
ncbi:DNA internalization-related competence protein ComEC/Rec2 [Marinobacter mobilis]|uniref:Competence protein ComEC n=1 Tax=Marinobacter mobilis TaxID=488533 RepID=A0A1H2UNQ5_9GAMM|nr:DNA internalization-related competence protein ComEC/Rec2 [Marinobacter mobilis]SDW57747.1 competence protein ComEC [Marinobacter mobilis]